LLTGKLQEPISVFADNDAGISGQTRLLYVSEGGELGRAMQFAIYAVYSLKREQHWRHDNRHWRAIGGQSQPENIKVR
jgi:hypothetical protein